MKKAIIPTKKRPAPTKTAWGEPVTWRDVLDCKAFYGHFDVIRDAARRVGYSLFLWNGRVYCIEGREICLEKDIQ